MAVVTEQVISLKYNLHPASTCLGPEWALIDPLPCFLEGNDFSSGWGDYSLQVPRIKHDGVSEGEVKAPSVEEYVGDLLSRIQPAPASEHRRKTVAQYVQDIIAKAFQPAIEASILVPEAKNIPQILEPHLTIISRECLSCIRALEQQTFETLPIIH